MDMYTLPSLMHCASFTCASISIAASLCFAIPIIGAEIGKPLANKKVAILAADGFEESELLKPKAALEEAGATTEIVSLERMPIKGWDTDHWSGTVQVDKSVNEARADDYDALLLPGGVMSPDKLRMNAAAVKFVQGFTSKEKPVAAICHGPWTLINAGALQGKTVTSWPSLRKDIENAGGHWVDEEVVTDRTFVTSRKPADIPAFNRVMIGVFASGGHA